MRYFISFISLMIFSFTISCAGQKTDYKVAQEDQMNKSSTKSFKHQKLNPIESLKYIPGEILIKFKDGTEVENIETIQERLGLTTIKVVSKQKVYLMKIQNGSSVEEVMKRLRNFREVEYSEPNYIRKFD